VAPKAATPAAVAAMDAKFAGLDGSTLGLGSIMCSW
jgi:hypothetical protein